MRALQAFVRSQADPDGPVSVGEAAADTVALLSRVLPTHDVTLTATGDASVFASPGEVRGRLVDLLVEALGSDRRRGAIELRVATDGGDAVVTVTGGGELRLPAEPV